MSTVFSLLIVKMWPYLGVYACLLYLFAIKPTASKLPTLIKLLLIFVGGLVSAIWYSVKYIKQSKR